MKRIVVILAVLTVLLPLTSFAAIPNWGPFVSCSGSPAPGSSLPRCTSICDLLATVKNIIEFGMTIMLFIIAPVMFVVGGFMVLVSGGNPGLRSKGMATLRADIIAIIMVALAFVIVNTFITLLNLKKGEGFFQGFGAPITCSAPPLTSDETTLGNPNPSAPTPLQKVYVCLDANGFEPPSPTCYVNNDCGNTCSPTRCVAVHFCPAGGQFGGAGATGGWDASSTCSNDNPVGDCPSGQSCRSDGNGSFSCK